jgi:predicted ATPase/DNA-binding CsgD family transcriptional regulator
MASEERRAGNLPTELTSFVGRRGEVAEVRRLLADFRLVTLTGAGGIGKTGLALRAAAGLVRAFPDGVWLVRLDQLRGKELVAQAVASVLGLPQGTGDSPAASLAEFLAGRQLLLVLDNCEHLVDAAAKLTDQLLRAAAGVRVLATSRESLNIDAEKVVTVPPLAAPDPEQPLPTAQVGLFPAVQLFAERAGQAAPGFAVTEANVAAVAGICRRLEGLPLAIELAAGRTRVLSLKQIEDRLGDRLGLLTRGSRAGPARQQTLRASITWSYELCTEPERLLWARLSVFAGGFELDAVEGVCADHRLAAEDMLELLSALADKSILIAEHLDSGVRYRLPDTVREYGQERLQQAGERAALRRRHRDWHEQLVARADADWGSPQMTEWTARLAREYANVRAAQDFCQTEPGETETGLRIVAHCLEALAWLAGWGQRHELAAVLLGTAAGQRRSMAVTVDDYQQRAGYQRDCERQARQALGETAFQAAYKRGLALPVDKAIGYALPQSPTPVKSPTAAAPGAPALAAPGPGAASLTPRETQVARLVAHGSSNKQIATRLVIAQRTAEGHVEHILAKLGFTSRAQVAAWIAASHPDDRRQALPGPAVDYLLAPVPGSGHLPR